MELTDDLFDGGSEVENERKTAPYGNTPASQALSKCRGASVLTCPRCPANVISATGSIGDDINPNHPPCASYFGDPDVD
jgi:hypothetical protein